MIAKGRQAVGVYEPKNNPDVGPGSAPPEEFCFW